MSELAKEKLYRKELIAGGATGNNNLERIRSLQGGGGKTTTSLKTTRKYPFVKTKEWIQKVWNGLDYFEGQYIWTDGTNIYYSNGNTQYVLNVIEKLAIRL